MASAVKVPRFYTTGLYASLIELNNWKSTVDNYPAPAPVFTCPPAPACALPPACPPAAVRECPPAPPPCNMLEITGIKNGTPYLLNGSPSIDIAVKVPSNIPIIRSVQGDTGLVTIFNTRINPYKNTCKTASATPLTMSGGSRASTKKNKAKKSKSRKSMKGGALPASYIFRPSLFNMDESSITTRVPLIFDYYSYLNNDHTTQPGIPIQPSLIMQMPTGQSNVVMGLNSIILNSFILDKDNVPHYITRYKPTPTTVSIAVMKRKDISSSYNKTSGIDDEKYFFVNIYYPAYSSNPMVMGNLTTVPTYDFKNSTNTSLNYTLDRILLEPIPDSLKYPNASLTKSFTAPAALSSGLPRMAKPWEVYTDLPRPPAPAPSSPAPSSPAPSPGRV